MIACLVCGVIAWLPGNTVAATDSLSHSLTFVERVAYQYAIEEVYWRHRIWPEENPGPKPPLGEVISEGDVKQKVSDYLTNCQALAGYSPQLITAAQLQEEMDRMARETKHSEVLRELFHALGDDPFVVAECLARPVLAESRLGELGRNRRSVEAIVSDTRGSLSTSKIRAYRLPEISRQQNTGDDTWTATPIFNAPEARIDHTAVWTGSEMIIWGGYNFDSGDFDRGAQYHPATNSWTATAVLGAPLARSGHTAVWTGTTMLIWGGASPSAELITGGRYNPATNSWVVTNTTNAPMARSNHIAVWTGTEMLIWGGRACGNNCNVNSGGRNNPETDSWTATSLANAPSPRFNHVTVWTGNELIVWSGTDAIPNTDYLRTGGRYDPRNDRWTPTSLMNVPLGRVSHTAVWTGNEMIVWSGVDESFNDVNTGGRYDPRKDTWVPTSVATGVPTPRHSQSAVWTGSEMIIWGGGFRGGDFNTGGRYDPRSDSWASVTTINAPFARLHHTAIWTGAK